MSVIAKTQLLNTFTCAMCMVINAIISTLYTHYGYLHVDAKSDSKLFYTNIPFHSNSMPICLVRDALLYLHLVMGTPWALLSIDRATCKRQLVGCYMSRRVNLMNKAELHFVYFRERDDFLYYWVTLSVSDYSFMFAYTGVYVSMIVSFTGN